MSFNSPSLCSDGVAAGCCEQGCPVSVSGGEDLQTVEQHCIVSKAGSGVTSAFVC